MNKVCFFLIFLNIFVSVCFAKTIELKSDRNAVAEVDFNKAKQAYTICVEFAPVTALNQIENNEVTETLARFFTEEALSVFLNEEKGVNFSRVKYEVLSKTRNNVKYKYIIPENEIYKAIVADDESSMNAMLGDYYESLENTDDLILDARLLCFRDIRTIEIYYTSKITNESNADKASLKKEIKEAFSFLGNKIAKDNALLLSEKDELQEKANKIEHFLLKKLSKSNQNLSSNDIALEQSVLDIISSPVFEKPEFKEFIIQDEILLTIGGCKAFETEAGKLALISVGIAQVRDSSSIGFINSLKRAERNAYQEIAKFQEVQITYFSTSTRVASTKKNNGDASKSVKRDRYTKTIEQSQEYVSGMEKVGYWYSKDKSVLFVALGCFID